MLNAAFVLGVAVLAVVGPVGDPAALRRALLAPMRGRRPYPTPRPPSWPCENSFPLWIYHTKPSCDEETADELTRLGSRIHILHQDRAYHWGDKI